MKSRASLFLTVLLLALSLTACGKEPAKNDRNDAGSGKFTIRALYRRAGRCPTRAL